MISTFRSVLLLAAITVAPVKIAAGFVGAERNSWPISTLAVILSTVAAVVAYKLAGGDIPGIGAAFLALIATYALILKTSLSAALGLAFLALLLQIAIISALASAGFSLLQAVAS